MCAEEASIIIRCLSNLSTSRLDFDQTHNTMYLFRGSMVAL
jgi:hypothetical protein